MNENQTVSSSEYSVVDWLGYVLWILRSGIGSQLYHIKFSFPLEFACVQTSPISFVARGKGTSA